jgi:hypothetical protein
MKSSLLLLPALVVLLSASSLGAGTASIQIDASKPGPKIDPHMYGIFLEELNHGVDGGLYAELIRNRAFEDAKPPEGFTFRDGRWLDEKGYDSGFQVETNSLPHWSLVKRGDARGGIYLDTSRPLNASTPRSLRLEIEEVSSGRMGVANGGFWGIGVKAGEQYNLSFWARCSEITAGGLEATLEDAGGSPCAQPIQIDGLTPEWKRFHATLNGTKSEAKARFVLTAGAKGTIWLDFVSLFPAKTWKNRANGLRPDIAQMIADLKPGFVRFPGGCVVEGATVETAYDWKLTLGPVEERQERWGAWNYRRTHGMGFLEYLQFCEDLGAEPLHVGFAGQTCLFRELENVPMADMGWVTTNFLDAIEYANGPATSKWGKLRADQGHAQPFNVKMVEIGNENGTTAFPPRYRAIHSVLKERYPDIRYIADLSWIGRDLMGQESFDIEDNHFYNNPMWFLSNQDMYGKRDRKLPPVYLGEVAVTSDEGGPDKGNLIAALSEGVYLMGAERNADVVKMVSYAPLLAHVSGRSGWHGMIYFDSTRAYGTVSYYLWKLFGLNRPDSTLRTSVEFAAAKPPAIAGAFGVGTWNTSAEFKDIRVEKQGQVLFASDFAKDDSGWKKEGGNWSVEAGAYRQKDTEVGLSCFGDASWQDYTLTLKARKLGGEEGFLIAFGRTDGEKSWWNVGGWGNREHAIEYKGAALGRHVPGKIELNRWYDVKVELNDRRIRCYLDGQLIHDETAPTMNRFFALAGRDDASGDIVIKAINTSSEPVASTLNIAGVERLEAQGELTVLKSERLSDNNSMDNPSKIVPSVGKVRIDGKQFPHEFPAYSLSILRLKSSGAAAQQSSATEKKPAVTASSGANLATVAQATALYVSPHETILALNSGYNPENSNDKTHGAYGNWPRNGTQWVQYEWSRPISTRRIDVYWFDDHGGVRIPKACRLSYWNGSGFVAVKATTGLGLDENKFNSATFDEITTSKLKLEFDSNGTSSTGILQWKVYDSGKSPNFAPSVEAGPDRVVVLSGKTHLSGKIKDDGKVSALPKATWSKESGPGRVTFENANAVDTLARFSDLGEYVLKLTANDGELTASDTLTVTVDSPFPATHLDAVYTKTYKINSPLWNHRIKNLIANWIPHCYDKISDFNLPEGGIVNFIEAGNKLAGRPHKEQKGAVFANAWVHNTVEAMCVALMVDPQGDQDILKAQDAMRAKLEDWIPKILSAQEPDGYLQTAYTLGGQPRWTNKYDHEGYLAGYFIESAIAHYLMSDKKDPRMYKAAKKLADCWYDNIGPAPKKYWYEGHQELEMALVRLARFVDDVEGKDKSGKYVELAKFLMDSRKNGDEYDQSHLPVTQQYEAVGHAVRAIYSYAGMADIAMETGNIDYQSAVKSIWENIVGKKYYVTGGIGSGETSEGFGKNYSLPSRAYCESCSGCGELFFQHKLNLACHESKYADLYEETLYNAILGDVDLEARNFTYTNPLDSGEKRYGWHVCPCCIGNIPRTLLMLPTWMYAKSSDSIYVNLFVGSTVTVENVAGTDVQLAQATDYPWSGGVSIAVNPVTAKRFTVKVRAPNRNVSGLYTGTPSASGFVSMAVNGMPITPDMDKGYAVIARDWKTGDKIEFVLPMPIQRIKAAPQVAADIGRVALRRGPLVYNIESVDQDINLILGPNAALSSKWNGDLLGGVMSIEGAFTNGAKLMAIPNYVRNNRGGRSIVWMKDE